MASNLTKADIVDVTDKWEPKTVGGNDLLQAQQAGQYLYCIIRDDLDARGVFYARFTNDGVMTTGSPFNLVPKKPIKTPRERILPFVDHWWRPKGSDALCRILWVGEGRAGIGVDDHEFTYLIEQYEHTASLENPQWENVP